ncbi:Acyl-CoA Delta(11) desaturase, partial [Blattella germanica]
DVEDKRLFTQPIKWWNILLLGTIHVLAVYALVYCIILNPISRHTWLFNLIYGIWGGISVTGGAHRLWTHRSYKAKTPLRVLLAIGHTVAGMNPIFDWVRDHRIHHKYSDTNADPHNANRGLFFSHCGWLMQKKHPEVIRRGREVDMSDVTSDPVVAFQEKYFFFLMPFMCIILPTCVASLCWGESWTGAFLISIFRWVLTINMVWSVNSFAHTYGDKPYNKNIMPSQNLFVASFALGEGWHNYHHVFPWDYKTAEIPYYFNLTTMYIEAFSCIGWAYDMKQASPNLIKQSVLKNGDGTHFQWGKNANGEAPEELATVRNGKDIKKNT